MPPRDKPRPMGARDLRRHMAANLARRDAARRLCVHFTTRDGATLSARATFRTLAPAAIRATARSRRSLDRPSPPASNPANSLNQKPGDSGIPNRFRPAPP
jgi:hypothetical protein